LPTDLHRSWASIICSWLARHPGNKDILFIICSSPDVYRITWGDLLYKQGFGYRVGFLPGMRGAVFLVTAVTRYKNKFFLMKFEFKYRMRRVRW
jgi:hypothetical protein